MYNTGDAINFTCKMAGLVTFLKFLNKCQLFALPGILSGVYLYINVYDPNYKNKIT
jgi:hypothetical protein